MIMTDTSLISTGFEISSQMMGEGLWSSTDTYHRTENINSQTEFASKFTEDPAEREWIAAEEDNTR